MLGAKPKVVLGANAIKVYKLKTKDKGPGNSKLGAKLGYNWSGALPPASMTLIVGTYSNENFSVTPKGKNYVGSSGKLQVKLIPKKHLLIAKAKGIDPVGGGNSPTVTLAMVDSGPIYDEDRKAPLSSGKYKENKNLLSNFSISTEFPCT